MLYSPTLELDLEEILNAIRNACEGNYSSVKTEVSVFSCIILRSLPDIR